MSRLDDLRRFYGLLDDLEAQIAGRRAIADPDLRRMLPKRGVYFFFEPGEERCGSGAGSRVVRVGTHALKLGSKSTLHNRLAQHRGAIDSGGGNHRGSVFRLLVGEALARKTPDLACPRWGCGSTESREVRLGEQSLEQLVSIRLQAMPTLWLPIDDEPGPGSLRGFVERNSIALLSDYPRPSSASSAAIDPPSADWLGHWSGRERVRLSGLWNNDHVNAKYAANFLDVLAGLIRVM